MECPTPSSTEYEVPNLDDSTIEDLTVRASRYLAATGGYEKIEFLDAGGSAAVFRVVRAEEDCALQAFNPELLAGSRGAAERR